jgi:hypothetical protein
MWPVSPVQNAPKHLSYASLYADPYKMVPYMHPLRPPIPSPVPRGVYHMPPFCPSSDVVMKMRRGN